MLIADGGGGYGGTDWMSKDVRFMWSTIADQETAPHYDVVGGWRKSADLILTHLGQVQMYRDNLASVWPPAKSAASAAYIARLDKLIADLKATHEAASANYTAFATVTLTLTMARNKLKPILDEYEANAQLNLDWKAKQDAAVAQKPTSPTSTPSPSPGPSPVSTTPPVSSARQEQLNNQARAIMYDLSSTVLSGHAALKKPELYNPAREFREGSDDQSSNPTPGSGFAVPPVIPPPGVSAGTGSGSAYSPVPHSTATPVTSIPPPPGSVVATPGSGPVLGGAGTTPVITPPTAGPPPPGPSTLPTPTSPGILPGVIPGPGGAGPATPGSLLPNGAKLPPNGSAKPGIGTGPTGRMTMPSGGVIGANPGSGMVGQIPAGTPSSRAGGPVRTNPVGGVIGQQGALSPARGGSPAVRNAGNQSTPFGSPANRGRSQREDATGSARWDPDNPWVTAEGVDPVVLPPEDQGPIDPGPAIGYSR